MTYNGYLQGGSNGTFTMGGVIDGINTIFTLPITPNALQVYRNGVFQLDAALGVTPFDFSWSTGTNTATITFQSPSTPQVSDNLETWVWTLVP